MRSACLAVLLVWKAARPNRGQCVLGLVLQRATAWQLSSMRASRQRIALRLPR